MSASDTSSSPTSTPSAAPFDDQSETAYTPFQGTNNSSHSHACDLFWALALGQGYHSDNRTHSPLVVTTNTMTLSNIDIVAENIPHLRLDPELQGYFFRMQQMAPRTCHPGDIYAKALCVVECLISAFYALRSSPSYRFPVLRESSGSRGSLFSGSGESRPVPALSKTLFFAAIADITYTRSITVLIHNVLAELGQCTGTWNLQHDLEDELVGLVVAAFKNSWMCEDIDALTTPTGLDSVPETLVPMLKQLVNIAALLGDLAGLSLISTLTMWNLINMLMSGKMGTVHCRALYLMLLRGGAASLGKMGMSALRGQIVEQGQKADSEEEIMLQRWFIEITNVIDRTMEHYVEFKVVGPTNLWDRTLDFHYGYESLLGLVGMDGGMMGRAEGGLMDAIMV